MTPRAVLAVDIGAESGRLVVGRFDGRRVDMAEVHRFPNRPETGEGGLLRWNLAALVGHLRDGLAKAATSGPVDSIGVDCFGLDYGFLDASGRILDDPVSHRDPRTRGVVETAVASVGAERIYAETGIQLLAGNAIYQLIADPPERLRRAARLLMVPDLFHHVLAGAGVAEYTAVTTSGAYDVANGRWANGLLTDLGIPTGPLPDVVGAGTDLGPLLPAMSEHGAYRHTRVITPASHDTASAVVGVPFEHPDAGYVSSGTWSLVGVETPAPLITAATRRANLSNEGGIDGTIRLLRNCGGLWLLQECRRHWRAGGATYEYPDLVALAGTVPGWRSVVDVEHPAFAGPGDMPARIRAYCRHTGQPEPHTVAETVRSVLDSLAFCYRLVFDDIEAATGRRIPAVHVVGGGSRNSRLNQLIADATGRPVASGPAEASALGNILVQLQALGEVRGLDQIRDVVRSATAIGRFTPAAAAPSGDLCDSLRARFRAERTAPEHSD